MTEPTQDISLDTPIGKLNAKGTNLTTLFTVLTFCASLVTGSLVWAHMDAGEKRDIQFAKALMELVTTAKEQVEEIRIGNCILALEIPDRKKELTRETNLCNRVIRGPRAGGI